MIYFAKNSGQKPGTASLEYPLFHGSLPPYGYQAVTNVDFAGLNDYFYSPTGWETFIIVYKISLDNTNPSFTHFVIWAATAGFYFLLDSSPGNIYNKITYPGAHLNHSVTDSPI